jgi:hypothetical protein
MSSSGTHALGEVKIMYNIPCSQQGVGGLVPCSLLPGNPDGISKIIQWHSCPWHTRNNQRVSKKTRASIYLLSTYSGQGSHFTCINSLNLCKCTVSLYWVETILTSIIQNTRLIPGHTANMWPCRIQN